MTFRPRFGAEASAPDARNGGILHLGFGSFHRAHQAVYTQIAREEDSSWAITGVASRSHAVVDALRQQNFRYNVATISPEGMSLQKVAVHNDAFVAADAPERVVTSISDPRTRIVTLTVTENGYSQAVDGGLNLKDPEVLADLAGGAPRTTIAQLALGLQARAASGVGLTILSCDNLANNGARTRGLVREFLQQRGDSAAVETLAYVDQFVRFPSSMVDRIVPATTDALRDAVAAKRGSWDEVPVPAEPFTMWALEDDFACGRPAWERGGAIFTNEVKHYEQMKVRLLNGTHSLLAYLGALSGKATIPESTAVEAIHRSARRVLEREYLPSITVPAGVNIAQYEEELFSRWANSALGHRTSQVGSDGSLKLRQRIIEPIMGAAERGESPEMIALTVAAYLACYTPMPGFEPGEHADAMSDPARSRLVELAQQARTGHAIAHAVLAEERLLGTEIAERRAFIDRVGELLETIRTQGVDLAIAESLHAVGA